MLQPSKCCAESELLRSFQRGNLSLQNLCQQRNHLSEPRSDQPTLRESTGHLPTLRALRHGICLGFHTFTAPDKDRSPQYVPRALVGAITKTTGRQMTEHRVMAAAWDVQWDIRKNLPPGQWCAPEQVTWGVVSAPSWEVFRDSAGQIAA